MTLPRSAGRTSAGGGPSDRVVVRRAAPGDAEAIATIIIDNWRATYRQQLSSDFLTRLDAHHEAARWRERMDRPPVTILVISNDGVRGFVASGPPFDRDLDRRACYQIYNLHVNAADHGRGYGKALLKEAAAIGAAAGAVELCLWVVPENDHARRFYQRAGLRPDGTSQREPVGPDSTLEEIRYRGPIDAVINWG